MAWRASRCGCGTSTGPGQALSNPYTGVLAIFAVAPAQRPAADDLRGRRSSAATSCMWRTSRRPSCWRSSTEKAAGGVFNVGSGEDRSVTEVAALLAQAMGRDIEPEIAGKARIGDIRHCIADIAKIRARARLRAARAISGRACRTRRMGRRAAGRGPGRRRRGGNSRRGGSSHDGMATRIAAPALASPSPPSPRHRRRRLHRLQPRRPVRRRGPRRARLRRAGPARRRAQSRLAEAAASRARSRRSSATSATRRRRPPRPSDAQAVFHFAAQVAVTTSLADPREDFDINVRGTLHLLEALRRRSDAGAAHLRLDQQGLRRPRRRRARRDRTTPMCRAIRRSARTGIGEDRPLDFHTPYGCSKGAADQYVLDYARSFGVPTACLAHELHLRPAPDGNGGPGLGRAFPDPRALQGEPISIYGDGCQVRDVLDVADAVEAYLAAWRRIDAVQGRAFNLGGGPANAVSLRQLLAHIEELLGRPVELDYSDWRAGDQRYYVSDTRRAARGTSSCEPRCPGARASRRSPAGSRGASAAAPSHRAPREPPRPRARRRRRRARERGLKAAPSGAAAMHSSHDRRCGRRRLAHMRSICAGGLPAHGVETMLAVLGPAPSADQRSRRRRGRGNRCSSTRPAARLDRRAAGRGCGGWRGQWPRLAAQIGPDVVHLNSPALAAQARFPAPGRRRLPFLRRDLVARRCARGPLPAGFRLAHRARRAEAIAHGRALTAPTAAFAPTTARRLRASHAPRVVRNGRRPGRQHTPAEPEPFVLHGRAALGRRQESRALDRAAARLAVPVAGRRARSRARTAPAIALAHVAALGRLRAARHRARICGARPIFVSRAALRALRAGRARSRAGRLRPRARPTSRPSANCGTARRSSSPPDDDAALAAAIERLVADPRRARGSAGPREARVGNYTVEAMSAGHAALYRAVLDRQAGLAAREDARHEVRLFHPFARLVLEPRQRAFPARRAARADPCAGTPSKPRARGAWSRENLLKDHGEAGARRLSSGTTPTLRRPLRTRHRLSSAARTTPTW